MWTMKVNLDCRGQSTGEMQKNMEKHRQHQDCTQQHCYNLKNVKDLESAQFMQRRTYNIDPLALAG